MGFRFSLKVEQTKILLQKEKSFFDLHLNASLIARSDLFVFEMAAMPFPRNGHLLCFKKFTLNSFFGGLAFLSPILNFNFILLRMA